MAPFMPAWRPLDASSSARRLSVRPGRGGGVVALCIGPGLAGKPEGALVAVELAQGWAAAGLEVLLVDGTVGTPSLHVPLGLSNGKGLADVILAGLEWEPLTVPTGTPGLRFLPAGGSAASAAPQDAPRQLADLCREVSAEGSLLVLYVPLGSMVTEWALGDCTDIVVLASEGESLAAFFDRDEDRIRALLGPSSQLDLAPGALASPRPPAAPVPKRAPAKVPPAAPVPKRAPDEVPPAAPAPERAPDEVPPAAPAPERAPDQVHDAVPDAVPDRVEKDDPALPPRPERRFRNPSPDRPSTERIEDAWARAAAALRAPERVRPEVRPAPHPQATIPPTRTGAVARSEPAREAELPPRLAILSSGNPAGGETDGDLRPKGRRSVARRGLGVLVAVTVLAAAAYAWNTTRGDLPFEAPTATSGATPDPDAGASEDVAEATEPRPSTAQAEPSPPSVPPAVGVTGAPHQRFSWGLAALGSLEAARALTERLGRAAPDQAFMVAPIVSNGRTLYRILGGLAEDRDQLLALRGTLAQRTGVASGSWLVREAPWAFLLQDFDDAAAATARARDLWNAGVPVYVLIVERGDGSLVHRLYAGAYETEQEAQALRAMLERAGVSGMTFTDRRGRSGR